MARDAGQPLELKHMLGGDAITVPVRQAGSALAHRASDIGKAKPAIPENLAERLCHGGGRFHNLKPGSSGELASRANANRETFGHVVGMTKNKRDNVHVLPERQPKRPHYIREWAKRGSPDNPDHGELRQADIAEALGVDKGLVSKWFNGSTPGERHQEGLAKLFGLDDPSSLFRHPDEDWMWRFLRDRPANEIDRIKSMLEAGFPRSKSV